MFWYCTKYLELLGRTYLRVDIPYLAAPEEERQQGKFIACTSKMKLTKLVVVSHTTNANVR